MTAPAVKICGVKSADAAVAAARAGADFIGFVFFRKSPRFLSAEDAEEIIMSLKQSSFEEGFAMPGLVGLFVDPGEKELAEVAPFLTHFQFHGHEGPERCHELGVEFAVDVIKAIPIAKEGDAKLADDFAEAVDLILFDAKPPPGAGRPGGHGVPFDWSLIGSYQAETPFLVAGGLTPDNVADAVAANRAAPQFLGVDVSSGVESRPGEKDPALIEKFLRTAKTA